MLNTYKKECEAFHGSPVCVPDLDPKNGMPGKNILVMFINERPGRIGPGQSNLVSFDNNDPTARRFKRLFEVLSIDRKRIIITNACIYYPQNNTYRDRVPNTKEINFSKTLLQDQIKRVNPKVLVPLGNVALLTLKKIYTHSTQLKQFTLHTHIGTSITDTNPYIFPVYHTSNRAEKTRKESDQEKDWKKLKKFILNNKKP